jgi:hypothetical protein
VISVVSHAWLLAGDDHLRAYIDISERFDVVHRANGGYRGRRLMQGVHDRSHLINMRWFDAVEDYERLITVAGYADWIGQLSAHIEPRNPQKEYVEVVLDTVAPSDVPLSVELVAQAEPDRV